MVRAFLSLRAFLSHLRCLVEVAFARRWTALALAAAFAFAVLAAGPISGVPPSAQTQPGADDPAGPSQGSTPPKPARTEADGPGGEATHPGVAQVRGNIQHDEKTMKTVTAEAKGPRDEESALAQDAQSYARDFGVGFEEALRRLKLQDSVGKLGAELKENERDTYAGLYIEHESEWRVVVRFTEGGQEKVRPYAEGGPLADEVEVEPAEATLEELEEIQKKAGNALKGLKVRADSLIDVENNRVELETTASEAPGRERLNAALRSEGVERPDKVETIIVDELTQPQDFNSYGGYRLYNYEGTYECTTGYTVYISGYGYGTSTAAHCDRARDWLYRYASGWYYQPLKAYPAGDLDGPYDVQFHKTPYFTDYAGVSGYGGAYRPIYYTKTRYYQEVGNYVCKYGTITGYTCGNISSKSVNLSYNLSSTYTFIRYYRSGSGLSSFGDSGGPVYNSGDGSSCVV